MSLPPYQPKPADTSQVRLPQELEILIEELARNTHEVWAAQRLAEGWRYGAERNDTRKIHPDLVPYDKLNDKEKEYDRQTAGEVLRVLLAMGYRIAKP